MDQIQKGNSNVTKGSIYDVATDKGVKVEEILSEADVIVMLDISSSMDMRLGDGSTRYSKATDALADIQKAHPGRVALITFSSDAKMELGGVPGSPYGSTNMMSALELGHNFDGLDTKFFLISDGEPDYGIKAQIIPFAKTFEDPIHCIFIGEDHDREGMRFMSDIAKVTGGENSGRISPAMLSGHLLQLVGRRD